MEVLKIKPVNVIERVDELERRVRVIEERCSRCSKYL